MFRLVTLEVPTPKFLLMCDNRNCGACTFTDVTGRTQEEHNSAAASFVAQEQLHGWTVGLTGHFCPACTKRTEDAVRQAVKAEAESKRLVQLANPLQQRMAEATVGKL